MEIKSRFKIHNKLFWRVYLYFGLMLSVFGVLIGFIFMKLYEKNTIETYHKQLSEQGERIANNISKYVMDEDIQQYNTYREVLEQQNSETTDVWIVSNPNAKKPMKEKYENAKITEDDLTKDARRVLNNAYHNAEDYSNSFDDNYGKVMMCVGNPIHDTGGNVIGAVLMYGYVENQQQVIQSSKNVIITSILVALLISFIIAILFARQLSMPITRMKETAMELAEGNYENKTNIRQHNEIGELAATLDVLSERLQENELERKNMEQMRMDFFANVSHELRTPITVMRGYTETLVDGFVKEEEKKKQYYSRMLQECKGMERLVGDLLILSKMQNPDFIIDAEPVNLVQIFDDIVRNASVMSMKKNITIQMTKDNECCMMMGDYDRLRQMFMVIVDNAIKFSEESSTIYIKLCSQEKLRVSIKDEGHGISEEELPYIFEKFYKSKLRQNATGSGLGLVIAKQIAIKHGGEITVSSNETEGTTFEFVFDRLDLDIGYV